MCGYSHKYIKKGDIMARSKILALSVFKRTFDLSYCDIIVMYESKKIIHYTVSKCPNTVKNFIKKHKSQFVVLTDNTYYHYYHYTFSAPIDEVKKDIFNLSSTLAEAPAEVPAEAPAETPAETPAKSAGRGRPKSHINDSRRKEIFDNWVKEGVVSAPAESAPVEKSAAPAPAPAESAVEKSPVPAESAPVEKSAAPAPAPAESAVEKSPVPAPYVFPYLQQKRHIFLIGFLSCPCWGCPPYRARDQSIKS